MPVYRNKETVKAIQWFPGKKVPGVVGDQTTDTSGKQWGCGCCLLGGPGWRPHVHPHKNGATFLACLHSIEVRPGDYIVYHEDGNYSVMGEDAFHKKYALEYYEDGESV